MRRFVVLLLCVLLIPLVSALEGFASPRASVSLGSSLVVSDSVVYSNGFVSDDGVSWDEFSFTGRSRGNWIIGTATSDVRTDANYYAMYSCTWNSGWSCSTNWQVYDQSTDEPLDQPSETNYTTKDSLQGDFEALQDLYQVTNGPDWVNNEGWESMTPETMGDAFGITVYPQEHSYAGRVQKIKLVQNDLTNIETYSGSNRYEDGTPITYNSLDDTIIDVELSGRYRGQALDKMYRTYEQYKLLPGQELQESLGNLKKLEYIDIRLNHLSGDLPDSLWNLTNLRVLSLGFSASDEPEIEDIRWPYPSKSNYYGNKFTGDSIPSDIENLQNLTHLYMERNYFDNSQIPDELWLLPNLQYLILNHNGFTGGLPTITPGFLGLESLHLLGGAAHSNRQQLRPVSYERFMTGELPESLGVLTELRILRLSHNRFTGGVPRSYANMESMRTFMISDMGLGGEFPTWINNDNMPTLSTLILSRNDMVGTLPEDYNVRNLGVFNIRGNDVSGPMPNSLINSTHPNFPKKVIIYDIVGNQFNGPFADDIQSMRQPRWIWLSDNNFTGELPQNFPSPSGNSFGGAHMFNNNFYGAISTGLGKITSSRTYYLHFGNNDLSSYEPGAISPVLYDAQGAYVRGLRGLTSFNIRENDMSQSDLDTIILDTWANVESRLGTEWENWGDSGRVVLDNQQSGAIPSTNQEVVNALENLASAGWTITYGETEN